MLPGIATVSGHETWRVALVDDQTLELIGRPIRLRACEIVIAEPDNREGEFEIAEARPTVRR